MSETEVSWRLAGKGADATSVEVNATEKKRMDVRREAIIVGDKRECES